MAVLLDAVRDELAADFMRQVSVRRELFDDVKAIVRTMIGEIDDGINTDATRMNNYLSEPGKSKATKAQKAEMFSMVLDARYKEDS